MFFVSKKNPPNCNEEEVEQEHIDPMFSCEPHKMFHDPMPQQLS